MQHKKPYVTPDLVVHGSVKKITQTANSNGGQNKPSTCTDGQSGTNGNNSCHGGGGSVS